MTKILVTQSSLPLYKEYCEEIRDIWQTHQLSNNGIKHATLETSLSNYFKYGNVSLFANGHLALFLAIKSMGLKGEVITTPFTFVSTINAIIENGLTPKFCDIDPINYTIDASKIEALITENTCAILPVHVYGNVCDVESIEKLANKYGLKTIYDAAHAFGIKYKGKTILRFGDINMLSFHATKVFNTIEGGALVYGDTNLYKKFNSLKNFGINQHGDVVEESINAKMNEFQAAMGLCNLRKINTEIEKRKLVAQEYDKLLANVKGISINKTQKNVETNYSYYPILINENEFGISVERLSKLFEENNIFCRRYFFPLVTDFEFYKRNGYLSDNTPIASKISKSILCLPMYADLRQEDINKICSIIRKSQSKF